MFKAKKRNLLNVGSEHTFTFKENLEFILKNKF